jgi:hypothetical protein
MAAGTIAVREALGPDVPDVTDREIQEALWHYYYDVGQTVTYILDTRAKKVGGTKKEKKKKKGGLAVSHSCLDMGKREFWMGIGTWQTLREGIWRWVCVVPKDRRRLIF